MKICVTSDLHDDMGDTRPVDWPDADVLIIAGDTANNPVALVKYLEALDGRYEHVLVVDGNHEHYANATIKVTVDSVLDYIANHVKGNVAFLPATGAVRIGDFYFVGRNGWYSFDYAGDPINNRAIWKQELNDNSAIGFDAIEQVQPWDRAITDAHFIYDAIGETLSNDPDARFVVVTHTAPHRDMVSTDARFLSTNAFFVNQHMGAVITDFGSNISMWCHGHTHHRRDKMINGVYVIANPRGYPSENPSWEPVVIEL